MRDIFTTCEELFKRDYDALDGENLFGTRLFIDKLGKGPFAWL